MKRTAQGEAKRGRKATHKELNAVSTSRSIDMTIDSGAVETVTSNEEIPEFPTIRPQGPERGTSYILPGGEVIDNKGEKHVHITTNEGAKCTVRMQVTDVRKSLMSVSKVCDAGHKVVFEQEGGYIEHIASGQKRGLTGRAELTH